MPRWYVQYPGAAVAGPIDPAELHAAWNRHHIPPGSMVCAEGFSNWVPFHTVAELAGTPPQSGASPPMGQQGFGAPQGHPQPPPQGYPPQGYPPQAGHPGYGAPPQLPVKKGSRGASIALLLVGLVILLVVADLVVSGGHGTESVVREVTLESKAAPYFKSNAAAILGCFHPTGVYERSGEVSVDGPYTIVGTIFWKGGVIGLEYVSTVKVHVPEASNEPVVAQLVSDTAKIPAVQTSCSWSGR